MRTRILLFLCFFAVAAAAQTPTPHTITPNRGPVAGGTEVRVTGDFGSWPYALIFGETFVPANRLDEHTLVATTPAHLPGPARVTIFEYDFGIDTGLTFTFEGEAEDAFDRLLLPVFTPPIRGAFGSEFRTELSGVNTGTSDLQVFGFDKDCAPIPECIFPEGEFVLRLEPLGADLKDSRLVPVGNPGHFFYVPKARVRDLSANLRAYDTSRAAENFGTEIPIVSSDEFRSTPFALNGVPRDPRFRSTLRLYAAEPTTVKITVGDQISVVPLSGNDGTRYPAYAQFSSFPVGSGTTRVVIEPAADGPTVWGFISVTNNETQHITTITPR